MRQYVLAYDLGTTGNKAVLVDEQCHLVASAFYPYTTFFPFDKAVEQDPWDWWISVRQSTHELLEQSGVPVESIAVISFSGQMMACVPLAHDGDPIGRALIWADMRSTAQAQRLNAEVGEHRLYQIVGNRANASYSAAKIMWVKENEPQRFQRTYKFVQPKDFVAMKMTGRFVTDYSDASGTNLFDLSSLQWSSEILAAAGIDGGLMPQAVTATTVVGTLTASAAEELQLVEGIPVVIGGADGACAAAGAGITEPGAIYQYMGSSSWLGSVSRMPILDERARIFNWAHVVPGLYAPTGTMQAAGTSFQWLRTVLERGGDDLSFERMEEMAAQSPPTAKALIFLPYLLGERSPIWDASARAAFVGLQMHHQTGDLIRAVMEGVALNMKGILDAFTEVGSYDMIRLIGGGAKSRLWAQILADVYGVPMAVPKVVDEATAMGAAVTGGVGVGLYPNFEVVADVIGEEQMIYPSVERHGVYSLWQPLYEGAYQALKHTFQRLSECSFDGDRGTRMLD
ncbi:MAG: xylulokinase [Sulfobacillus acidophilus]|uniref:Xylulose kinase n=1 Tax=Sulfobacillus acidophilus TaxID=53633 RepID=A0A2T2WE56_9FIRM|nr:MAG: xylulokinase [Sulfobacillus acidophilus]